MPTDENAATVQWLRWRWHRLIWRNRDATWWSLHSYGCEACEDR